MAPFSTPDPEKHHSKLHKTSSSIPFALDSQISSSLSEKAMSNDKLRGIQSVSTLYPDEERGQSSQSSIHEDASQSKQATGRIDPDENDTALSRLASTTHTRSRSRSNLPPPPDGGLQAWTQVVAGWLVIFATWGYMNSFGSFQSWYTTAALNSESPSSISWIGSLQGCLTTAIGAFTGRLLDAGLFRPTFAVGAIVKLIGIFSMSIPNAPKYWQLVLTQGVLTGLGGGILFTPTLALVATWFGRRRGLAIGLATTGNSTGGIVYPIIVKTLIPKVGFAWTARILGLVNLTCYGVAFLLMRSRLPPRRSGPVIDWAAFKEPVYVLYVCGMFLFVWANYYLFYYVSTTLMSKLDYSGYFIAIEKLESLTSLLVASFGIQRLGLSYSNASYLVMIINGAGLPARVLVPMMSDRVGALNMIAASLMCVAVVMVCWFGVSNVPGFYAFTAVCGLVSGAIQSLIAITLASITKRLDTVGTRLGMCFSILSIASLTGPPLGGALQSASRGSFTGPQAWAAASTFIGAFLVVLARVSKVGWTLKARC